MSNAAVLASPGPPENASNRPKTQLVIFVITVVATSAMIMVMMFRYSLQPSTVELTSLSVPSFTAKLAYPLVGLNSTWEVHVRITNKESRWGARYEKLSCTLYNQRPKVGLSRVARKAIEPFGLAAGEEKTIAMEMRGSMTRVLHGWDFRTFSVRVEAESHFDVETRVGGMLVSKCRPIDATCSGMRMMFRKNEGKLYEELSDPKLCEEGMPLNNVINPIDGVQY